MFGELFTRLSEKLKGKDFETFCRGMTKNEVLKRDDKE